MASFEADEPFRPAAWLRNAHLQSTLSSIPPRNWLIRARARALRARAEPWLIECGADVRLLALYTRADPAPAPRRTAMLLHGWEGGAQALYVQSAGAELLRRGFDVVRLNLRDHGGTQSLNRELFHSCRLPEVVAAVAAVAARVAPGRLYLAGFSLGGNFMLRVASEPAPPPNLAGVVAISPVLDPDRTLEALETGLALYHSYFVRRWTQSLRIKARSWPGVYHFEPLVRSRNLRQMTADLVRAYTDFPTLADYLNGYAITGERLASLSVPSFLLTAADDPIIPIADLQRLAPTPLLTVRITEHGGHCGFVDHVGAAGYAERFIAHRCAALEAAAGAPSSS
jgi:predicted alpha/beta-fold hydrolase